MKKLLLTVCALSALTSYTTIANDNVIVDNVAKFQSKLNLAEDEFIESFIMSKNGNRAFVRSISEATIETYNLHPVDVISHVTYFHELGHEEIETITSEGIITVNNNIGIVIGNEVQFCFEDTIPKNVVVLNIKTGSEYALQEFTTPEYRNDRLCTSVELTNGLSREGFRYESAEFVIISN